MRLTVTILVALSFFTSALAQRAMNEVFHRDKTFRKIKYLIRDGEEAEMVKADLIIRFEYLEIRTDQGEPIADFHYSHISSADYNYSERPRWKTPTLFKKGKDHWYTIRAGRESAILQLDKSNYRLVVDAVQRKLKSRKGIRAAFGQGRCHAL